jgi:hypothetical protein
VSELGRKPGRFGLALLVLIAAFGLFLAALLGLGIVAALFLHWLWPRIDLGTWIVTCVIGTGFTVHFLARAISWFANLSPEHAEPTEEETVFIVSDYLPRWRRRPPTKKERP